MVPSKEHKEAKQDFEDAQRIIMSADSGRGNMARILEAARLSADTGKGNSAKIMTERARRDMGRAKDSARDAVRLANAAYMNRTAGYLGAIGVSFR